MVLIRTENAVGARSAQWSRAALDGSKGLR